MAKPHIQLSSGTRESSHHYQPSDAELEQAHQAERYQRQTKLPEIGTRGQDALAASHALVVGLGGLGSPAAMYLAGAGVGHLGLVDPDCVELSNLHRQPLYPNAAIGTSKVTAAMHELTARNPSVALTGFPTALTAHTAAQILAEPWDVVLDCGDNFALRYLLSDLCQERRVPLFHGAVYGFDGQATSFLPGKGTCYRCLFPTRPPCHGLGSCEQNGVLGMLPGIIGMLQATEAVKELVGVGSSLSGVLFTINALTMQTNSYRYGTNPSCANLNYHRATQV